jgi:hypothetical protein
MQTESSKLHKSYFRLRYTARSRYRFSKNVLKSGNQFTTNPINDDDIQSLGLRKALRNSRLKLILNTYIMQRADSYLKRRKQSFCRQGNVPSILFNLISINWDSGYWLKKIRFLKKLNRKFVLLAFFLVRLYTLNS